MSMTSPEDAALTAALIVPNWAFGHGAPGAPTVRTLA